MQQQKASNRCASSVYAVEDPAHVRWIHALPSEAEATIRVRSRLMQRSRNGTRARCITRSLRRAAGSCTTSSRIQLSSGCGVRGLSAVKRTTKWRLRRYFVGGWTSCRSRENKIYSRPVNLSYGYLEITGRRLAEMSYQKLYLLRSFCSKCLLLVFQSLQP